MRVGLFTDAYLPEISGVTTVVNRLKKELERLGHVTYIYAPGYGKQEVDSPGVFRFPSQPFMFHKASRVAFPYSRGATHSFERLDIVHSHAPFSMGLLALGVATRYRIPHVHTYHTYLSEYRHYLPVGLRPPKKAAERASAAFCNHCTAVTAPSTPIKEELIRYGVHRPIHVLPFGVDLSPFQRPAAWRPRCSLGIPQDAPLLLHVGRLAREKNLPFLIRVFADIHAADPRVTLVVAGDGPLRGQLERQAEELGLSHCIIFTGFIDHPQLIDLYKEADLFLFSSKTETQGLVLLEAMAGATPVVAIGRLGVLDVVKDGKNGLLAPEDEGEYKRLALDLLGDHHLYERLRQGAIATARQSSAQKATQGLLDIFKGLVS